MVNKKGFLRIVEATLSIIIIFGAILIISSRTDAPERKDMTKEIAPILEEIASNASLREKIIGEPTDETKEEIKRYFKDSLNEPSLEYGVEICEIDAPCYLSDYPDTDSDLFASERVVSASIRNENFKPKKVKVFMWRDE